MTKRTPSPLPPEATPPARKGSRLAAAAGFEPVPTKARHDGWTPEKQHDFILALAETGCVTEAAAAVGMSSRSAYRLRARAQASAFRQSWDIALDYAVRRLTDAAFARAIHGVARPIFYQGEQVGERRYYNDRLTMFLMRYRDPTRYGAWLDQYEARRHPDGAAITLASALNAVTDAAYGYVDPDADPDPDGWGRPLDEGPPPPAVPPLPDYDGPEEGRPIAQFFAAQAEARRQEAALADPAAKDRRHPLITRRPRREGRRDRGQRSQT